MDRWYLDMDGSIHRLEDPREGPMRYAAYFARIKALFSVKASGALRYLAFTSDVGEAVRPVVPRAVVNASYGVACAYMAGDVAYHGYRARSEGGNAARAVAQAATFQFLASLAVPVAVIHTVVHQSQKAFRRAGRCTKWGPSALGLACIPVLPYAIDEPIEHGVERMFGRLWPEEGQEGKGGEACG